jgi:hypothetical protein
VKTFDSHLFCKVLNSFLIYKIFSFSFYTFKRFQGILSAASGTFYEKWPIPLQNKTNIEQQYKKLEARQEIEQLPKVFIAL